VTAGGQASEIENIFMQKGNGEDFRMRPLAIEALDELDQLPYSQDFVVN
jgi:hypothetical protein